jgi:hypothetical protein
MTPAQAPQGLRSPWLRLGEVVAILVGRGLSQTQAREQITVAVSRGKLPVTEHTGSGGPRLNLPMRPEIPARSVRFNIQWLVNPVLDFNASTIVVPCSVLLEPNAVYRATLLEIHAEDIDRLWPAGASGRVAGTKRAETECARQLRKLFKESPPGTAVHTKDELRPKFLEQFGGELSRRAFDRAWIEAGKENIAYATAGRRKSRQ